MTSASKHSQASAQAPELASSGSSRPYDRVAQAKNRALQAQHYQALRRCKQRKRHAWHIATVCLVVAFAVLAFAVSQVVATYEPFLAAEKNIGLSAQAKTAGSSSVPGSPSAEAEEKQEGTSEEQSDASITLTMVGDILVHKGVWQSGEAKDGTRNYDHLFAEVKPELEAADVAIVNQETILGSSTFPLSGYPSFNSPQEIGDAEVAAGVDLIAHASNHSVDLGSKGVAADLAYWRSAHPNIAVIGISDTPGTPNSTWLYEKDGFKLGFINATYGTNQGGVPQDNPSAVRILSESELQEDVAALRAQGVDAIVCIPHWGNEYHTDVSAYQKEMAAHMADLGVDVIIGAHPHVIEPVETITSASGHQTLVFWSLGNYVSTQAQAKCMIGGMATVTLTKSASAPTVDTTTSPASALSASTTSPASAPATSDAASQSSAKIQSYSFTPVICQRNFGHDMRVYKLADYTDELARANNINPVDKNVQFTREWCLDFCQSVLGPEFNRETAVLTKNVSD